MAEDLVIRVAAYDAASSVLDSIADKIGALGSAGILAGAGVAALGIGLVNAASAASGFTTMLTDIANNTGLTTAQIQQLKDSVIALGDETGAPLEQIAHALEHATNVTRDFAAAQAEAKVGTESAVSTGADAAQVTNLLAGVMHEYGLDVSTASTAQARYNEVLTNANAVMGAMHLATVESNTTLDQFTDATSKAVGIAANLGVSYTDVFAAVSSLTRHGFPDVYQAGTQVTDMLTHMLNPSASARKAIDELAVATGDQGVARAFDVGNIQARGFVGTIDYLKESMDKANISAADQEQIMNKVIPALRGGLGAAALVGTANRDMNQTYKDLNDTEKVTAVTHEAFMRTLATTGGQMNILKDQLRGAQIQMGEGFQPVLVGVLQALNGAVPVVQGLAGAIGSALGPAFDQLGTALASVGQALAQGGIGAALQAMLAQVNAFGAAMFGAGWNIVQQLGAGIVQGAETIIVDAANVVAQLIADFLVGQSPPKKGPLHELPQGGKNAIQSYLRGMMDGAAGAGDVAKSVGDALGKINTAAGTDLLAKNLQDARQSLLSMKDAGGLVQTALTGVNEQVQQIQYNQRQAQFAADGIKADYEGQIQPLQDALDNLRSQVDYANQIADAQDKVTLAQLNQRILEDQGDPVKRAALQQRLDGLRAQQQELSIQSEIATIEAQKKQSAGDPAKLQSLNLREQELGIQQQIADLANKPDLAAAQLDKAKLQNTVALRDAEQAVLDAQRKQKELDLEKQIADKKEAEKQALVPINQQLESYKQQLATLTLQKNELTDLSQVLKEQEGSLQRQASALGGLGGAGAKLPKGGAGVGGLNLTGAGSQIGASIKGALDDASAKFASDASAAGQKVGEGLLKGAGDWIAGHMVEIVGGALGALAGAALFGPIGLALGAGFGAKVAEGVQQRVPDVVAVVGRMFEFFGDAWKRVLDPLSKGDVFGALVASLQNGATLVEAVVPRLVAGFQRIGEAASAWLVAAIPQVRAQLDVWRGQVTDWLAANVPVVAAAFDEWRMLAVDWIGHATAPLLIRARELLTELGAWVVGTAVPALVEDLKAWGEAFIAWVVPAAEHLRNNLGPMLDRLGGWIFQDAVPAIRADLLAWGTAFATWVAPAIPPLIKELAKLLVELLAWTVIVAFPAMVEKLQEWGQAFTDWVGPRVPILLEELGKLLLALVVWIGTTAAPDVVKAAWEVGKAIVTGTIQGLQSIQDQIGTALNQALTKEIQGIRIDVGPFHLSSAGFRVDAPQLPAISLPGGIGGGGGAPAQPGNNLPDQGPQNAADVQAIQTVFGGNQQAWQQAHNQQLQALAGGGPVITGRAYLVGEEGMEVFVPQSSGTVVSNRALGDLGGGVHLHVTINAGASVLDTASLQQFAIALKPELARVVGI